MGLNRVTFAKRKLKIILERKQGVRLALCANQGVGLVLCANWKSEQRTRLTPNTLILFRLWYRKDLKKPNKIQFFLSLKISRYTSWDLERFKS